MSEWHPPPEDNWDEPKTRAVWGLVALGIIAVIVVVVLFAIGGGSGGRHPQQGLSQLPSAPLTVPPTSSNEPTATPKPSPTAHARASAATATIPTSTANPCPGATQCAVPGDAGHLVAAVNQFRVSHGAPPVAGTVSAQAQQCALAQGDGAACNSGFAWEPVPTQSGPKAVELVAGHGDGTAWLLDPSMTSFSVGWGYAGGQYECAILKAHA